MKNRWIFRWKIAKIVKKSIRKTMLFSSAFFNWFSVGFGRVLGWFWEGFGTFLASLGELLALFFWGLVAKRAQEAAKRLLGLDLGWVWRSLGGQNWAKIEIFHIFLDKRGMVKNTFFLMGVSQHKIAWHSFRWDNIATISRLFAQRFPVPPWRYRFRKAL